MPPDQALLTLHADYIGGWHANYRKSYFAAQLGLDDAVGPVAERRTAASEIQVYEKEASSKPGANRKVTGRCAGPVAPGDAQHDAVLPPTPDRTVPAHLG